MVMKTEKQIKWKCHELKCFGAVSHDEMVKAMCDDRIRMLEWVLQIELNDLSEKTICRQCGRICDYLGHYRYVCPVHGDDYLKES